MQSSRIQQLKSVALLLVILSLAVVLAWREGVPERLLATMEGRTAAPPKTTARITEDRILEVSLIDINFWEARLHVKYQQKSGRSRGYLALDTEPYGMPGVGIPTRAGIHEGIAIVNRQWDRPEAYSNDHVVARIYDPYRSDFNFARRTFPVKLEWPGVESLDLPEPEKSLNSDVETIYLYRNIPDYIRFARDLTRKGLPPERMAPHLAVCRHCKGSLIYGDGVGYRDLRTVLQTLREHGFKLEKVLHSKLEKDEDTIRVGETPKAGAKPLWSKLDRLLAADITEKAFFETLGFPRASPRERAKRLHAEAKPLIDHDEDLDRARTLLDRALATDDSYMPIYIELARLKLVASDFDMEQVDERLIRAGREAETILQAALKIDPDYADTWVLLGFTQAYQQQFEEAEASFDRAEELGTDNWWLDYNRSMNDWYRGDLDGAVAHLETYLDREPVGGNNDRALMHGLFRLALLQVERKEGQDAFETLARMHEFFPDFYQGNTYYLKRLIAFNKRPALVDELIRKYRDRDWYMGYHADAMRDLLSAADLQDRDPEAAQRALTRARASRARLHRVVADLLQGDRGRAAIRTLLRNEALTMREIEQNGSLLMPLLDQGALAPIRFALDHFADPNLLVNSYDTTPLMAASASADIKMIRLLLEYGGKPELENAQGVSAAGIARALGREEVLALMKDNSI